MKISDPFCRVQRRDEKAILQLHERLLASGDADRPAVHRIRRQGLLLAAKMATLIAMTAAAAALLFPASRVIFYLLAALGWTWIAAGYLKSRALLQRYEIEYLIDKDTLAEPDPRPSPTTAKSRLTDD